MKMQPNLRAVLPLAILLVLGAAAPGRAQTLEQLLDRGDSGRIARWISGDPDRLGRAAPSTRARIIDLMQRVSTGDLEERAIVSVLAGADPLVRAETFRLVDLGDDEFDLDQLVFHDVDDSGRRRTILRLADEANAALQTRGLLEIGVISDIDDTALPHKNGPEGFRAAPLLYRFLEVGPDARGKLGDVHFVTARPSMTMGSIRNDLILAGFPLTSIEEGSATRAVFGGFDGLQREKIEDVERLLVLHPRQRFILLGDDRDRDPEVYRSVLRRYPDRILCAMIRRAGGLPRNRSRYPGIHFFDGYDQAALALRELRALSSSQMDQVRRLAVGG